MSPDDLENLAIKNTQSISTLTEIAKNTSKDVDKLVKHMDAVLPVATRVDNLNARVTSLETSRTYAIRTLFGLLVSGICYAIVELIKVWP